jgi:hypothetical protein
MSRPRLAVGTFGDVGFSTSPSGRVIARASYRDWDGKSRLVQASGESQRAAELALKAKLSDRDRCSSFRTRCGEPQMPTACCGSLTTFISFVGRSGCFVGVRSTT